MPTSQEVAAFIAEKSTRLVSLSACSVTIGDAVYPSARYTEKLEAMPGTPAYAKGGREYMREFLYCVGMLPAAKLRGNVCYRMEGDDRDWYVAGYYGNVRDRKQEIAEVTSHHPWGNSFMLAPWVIDPDRPEIRIDSYHKTPYPRGVMVIENVEPVIKTQTVSMALDDLDDVIRQVFGNDGSEPNIFADYDNAVAVGRKAREALEFLRANAGLTCEDEGCTHYGTPHAHVEKPS